MRIKHVEIGNFRKLQAVRIDFADETTLFVGANNSGKTSAMVALRRFLIERKDFSLNDFTLSHWGLLDTLGHTWEKENDTTVPDLFDWGQILPFLDVWLDVPQDHLHYVQPLLPTLDWDGASIGVRLRYEPRDPERLKFEYLKARQKAERVMASGTASASTAVRPGSPASPKDKNATTAFSLWPCSLTDFLIRRLDAMFEVRAYLLDPARLLAPAGGLAKPQPLPANSDAIDGTPFKDLIRIDEISAQRGFGLNLPAHDEDDASAPADQRLQRRLSAQLRAYYTHHLNPLDAPEPQDLAALKALFDAQQEFGKRIEECFSAAFGELQSIGYPGVTDPKLTIAPKLKPIDGLNHASAVQFQVPTHQASGPGAHRLPEDSNGLGYQNLISIVFALMSFRDKWMRVGKAGAAPASDDVIPPLHLILIEEPEAHLHAQVQKVFIKQAYKVLRNHDELGASDDLRTQLVVSTHSSHIAHEADFASLRYFRRLPAPQTDGAVPISAVVNLSEIFGATDDTTRFVKRYIKATHCDLFFADGAIVVEGPAERILVPHLVRVRPQYTFLNRCYITWLEIGGSHAHRLKPLLEHLGLNTLIITDIDAKDGETNKKVALKRGSGQKTRNETLKTWLPKHESLDALLDAPADRLVYSDSSGYGIRVAYQQPISVQIHSGPAQEALPNTFEDAFLYENIEHFQGMTGTALLGTFARQVKDSQTLDQLAAALAKALENGSKAELALDLLMRDEVNEFKVPSYIHHGLVWLMAQLTRKEAEVIAVGEVP